MIKKTKRAKKKKDPLLVEYGLDSFIEIHYYWYLLELEKMGYISKIIKHPKQEEILPKVMKGVKGVLLNSFNYTPDFLVYWNDKAYNEHIVVEEDKATTKAIYVSQNGKTYIEIKPDFDMNNMTRDFRVKQKVIYHALGRYVQLVIVPKIFKSTFTPLRYLMQDKKSNRRRSIKFKINLFSEWVQGKF